MYTSEVVDLKEKIYNLFWGGEGGGIKKNAKKNNLSRMSPYTNAHAQLLPTQRIYSLS